MQAINPVNIEVNIAMMNYNRKRNLEENGLYALGRKGQTNWISEAVVAQTIHETMRYSYTLS